MKKILIMLNLIGFLGCTVFAVSNAAAFKVVADVLHCSTSEYVYGVN
jgi:hypothetical protein